MPFGHLTKEAVSFLVFRIPLNKYLLMHVCMYVCIGFDLLQRVFAVCGLRLI